MLPRSSYLEPMSRRRWVGSLLIVWIALAVRLALARQVDEPSAMYGALTIGLFVVVSVLLSEQIVRRRAPPPGESGAVIRSGVDHRTLPSVSGGVRVSPQSATRR